MPDTQILNTEHGARVEQLIAAVYTELYGPIRWQSKTLEARAGIVKFAIDQVAVGLPRALIHTTHERVEHYLDAKEVTP